MNVLSKEKTIEYLNCIKNLEISLRSQKLALNQMQTKANSYHQELNKYHGFKEKPLIEAKLEKYTNPGFIGNFIACCIFLIPISALVALFSPLTIKPCLLWGAGISCVLSVYFSIQELVTHKDEKDTAKRNEETIKETEERNKKIKEENEKNLLTYENARSSVSNQLTLYNSEANRLLSTIRETESLLKKYYAIGVIYPKYRSLVYICSIHEYLDSGRCDALEGPHGAYNLLEEDIKFARVLDKLDVIAQNLEEIKENQRELYYAICETNSNIEKLNGSLSIVSGQLTNGIARLDNINQTLDCIEYNSKVTSTCTQYSAMYDFFKN